MKSLFTCLLALCLLAAPCLSNAAAVTGTISSATQSTAWRAPDFASWKGPREFHIKLTGTFVATCVLTSSATDSGYKPVTVFGTALYTYTGEINETISAPTAGDYYKLDCGTNGGSYTSGTITYTLGD